MNWFSLKNTASCTTFVHGSKKIFHNSFWEKPDIKFQTHPGMSTYSTHQLSKRQTHPGMFTQIFLENFVINAKPKPFSVNKRKKHTSIFRSNHHLNILKPTLITSLKNRRYFTSRTHIHLVQSIAKTASSLIKSISINVFLPQGRDWPFLAILDSSKSSRHDKDESRSLRI